MARDIFYAWAIFLETDDWSSFAGRYYFGEHIPNSLEGCKKALFKTRKIAREYCKRINPNPKTYKYKYKTKVVKVKIQITEAIDG